MPSEVSVASYRIGPQEWRRGRDGWYVLMWGWFPFMGGTPTWQWVKVDDKRVPKQILEATYAR